ncbi:putative calmodulin [Trypanosoma conorhini]|uniref:Putative calmodulin n=1 Tax=Trypanosoma conorhini TaxID=83891 RepID=A0A3R7P9S7_9TRYP|nr:putative calmodulin [Trypanosoma conorhini]RNF15160.1 putative calmodulin [Trypanosoma conorhini]
MRYTLGSVSSACDGLSAEERRLLRDSFVYLDTDGDGVVRPQELRDAFGEDVPAPGLPGSETLDLAAYLELFARHMGAVRRLPLNVSVDLLDDEMRLLEVAFDSMDTNGDGFIDEEELCGALTESLGMCETDHPTVWLTGVVMARVDRDADGRLTASDFIRALQEDGGAVPRQLLTLRLKTATERGRLRAAADCLGSGVLAPLRRPFSSHAVFLVLRVADARLCNEAVLTAAQFCASFTEGFVGLQQLLDCVPEELASHLCRRALLLSPHPDTVGGIDCRRFLELILDDPGRMLLNVPPHACRLESSMRHLECLSYEVGRQLALTLWAPDLDAYTVQQLDELPRRLRAAFPAMKRVTLWSIVRDCTAAAVVTSDAVFSLRRLVRRLTIRFCVLPRGYAGRFWRRLSPLERCRIRSHLLRTPVEEFYTATRREVWERVRASLLGSDDFLDQESVASAVAACVASMTVEQRLPPEEVRRAIAQESWPPSDDLAGEDCRLDIAVKMLAVDLGREGLSAVAKSLGRLDTAADGIVNEELLLSTLRGVVGRLRPCWSSARVDGAVCDVVLSCELTEGGTCVKCGGLLERLRLVQ